MRKRLIPAKLSFLGEGNVIKRFFSPVNCMVTSVVPPTPLENLFYARYYLSSISKVINVKIIICIYNYFIVYHEWYL